MAAPPCLPVEAQAERYRWAASLLVTDHFRAGALPLSARTTARHGCHRLSHVALTRGCAAGDHAIRRTPALLNSDVFTTQERETQ